MTSMARIEKKENEHHGLKEKEGEHEFIYTLPQSCKRLEDFLNVMDYYDVLNVV
jgi:hypothetical protein